MKHHLIFEGADLAGKSWIMSQIYQHLEQKYGTSKFVLDGCHWFNCDIGLIGTAHGLPLIESHAGLFKELHETNIIVEKFHISDIVHNRMDRKAETDYHAVEERLAALGFKIFFVTFPEDVEIISKRVQDRLNLYPQYERIVRTPEEYIEQQKEYRKEVGKSSLPTITIHTENLPDQTIITDILKWMGEI